MTPFQVPAARLGQGLRCWLWLNMVTTTLAGNRASYLVHKLTHTLVYQPPGFWFIALLGTTLNCFGFCFCFFVDVVGNDCDDVSRGDVGFFLLPLPDVVGEGTLYQIFNSNVVGGVLGRRVVWQAG